MSAREVQNLISAAVDLRNCEPDSSLTLLCRIKRHCLVLFA